MELTFCEFITNNARVPSYLQVILNRSLAHSYRVNVITKGRKKEKKNKNPFEGYKLLRNKLVREFRRPEDIKNKTLWIFHLLYYSKHLLSCEEGNEK
jgi:hypothetical protein